MPSAPHSRSRRPRPAPPLPAPASDTAPEEALERARRRLLAALPGLTSAAGGAQRPSPGRRARLAEAQRWERQGRLFSVPDGEGRRYFRFQFGADRRPRPVVRRVLRELGPGWDGWAVAFWFASAHGELDGARPVDRLARRPDDVVRAAAASARAASTDY